MSFQCPECRSNTLQITSGIDLTRDSRSDEITLQVVRCSRCGFAGLAVYEESRRGSLFDESVDHRGYPVNAEDLAAIEKAIARCPDVGNWRCTCPTHQRLGRRNEAARWDGLSDVELGKRFEMWLKR